MKVIHALVVVISCGLFLLLVFLVARKEDNFRVMDRVLITLGNRFFSHAVEIFGVGPRPTHLRPKPRVTIKT